MIFLCKIYLTTFFISHRKSSSSKSPNEQSKDKFQRVKEAKLQRLKNEEKLNGKIDGNLKDDLVDLDMQIPKSFSEARKKALLVFFINHFIALAKKSNEFRAYGQSLMLVLQSQNLVKLLEELGYGETKECSDFRIQLEKLRSICRVGAEGYWRVNWGYEDGSHFNKQPSSENLHSSVSKQKLPLPDLPKRSPSPILGTESPNQENERRQTVAFVEVHEMNNETSDL